MGEEEKQMESEISRGKLERWEEKGGRGRVFRSIRKIRKRVSKLEIGGGGGGVQGTIGGLMKSMDDKIEAAGRLLLEQTPSTHKKDWMDLKCCEFELDIMLKKVRYKQNKFLLNLVNNPLPSPSPSPSSL